MKLRVSQKGFFINESDKGQRENPVEMFIFDRNDFFVKLEKWDKYYRKLFFSFSGVWNHFSQIDKKTSL